MTTASLLDLELPRVAAAGQRARHAVEPLIGHGLRREECSDVLLLTTELVTNAVRHGTGDVLLLCAKRASTGVRVEVRNQSGTDIPVPTDGGPEGGWGLQLVEAISSRWGQSAQADCTLVWFELGAPRHTLRARP